MMSEGMENYVQNAVEIWSYLKGNAEKELELESTLEYSWLSVLCRLFTPSYLPSNLQKEKRALVKMSRQSFNDDDVLHRKMLFTLFYQLTGTQCCSRYGPHWESIGFQGTDPGTDFRGVGILGLFQPLMLSLLDCTLPFLQKVLEISHNSYQGFPFMVLSLNITRMVLCFLRNGLLDKVSCRRQSVVETVNHCYGAILYHIYEQWVTENMTLVQSGQLLKKCEQMCSKDLVKCMKKFESYLENYLQFDPSTVIQIEEVHLMIDSNQ